MLKKKQIPLQLNDLREDAIYAKADSFHLSCTSCAFAQLQHSIYVLAENKSLHRPFEDSMELYGAPFL